MVFVHGAVACISTSVNKLLVLQKRAIWETVLYLLLLNQTVSLYSLYSFNNFLKWIYDIHAKTGPKILVNKFTKSVQHIFTKCDYLQRTVSLSNFLELKKWENLLLELMCLSGILFHILLKPSTYLIFIKKIKSRLLNVLYND